MRTVFGRSLTASDDGRFFSRFKPAVREVVVVSGATVVVVVVVVFFSLFSFGAASAGDSSASVDAASVGWASATVASASSEVAARAAVSVVDVLLTVVAAVGLPRLRIEEIGRGEATRLVTASLGLEAVVDRISTDGAVVDSFESAAVGRRVGPNRLRIPEATGRRLLLLAGWTELLSTLSPCG